MFRMENDQMTTRIPEQIIKNHLITESIFKHLDYTELLNMCLVNSQFKRVCRDYLKNHRRTSIIIGRDPCGTLARFNTFLEENADDDNVFYNGITYGHGRKRFRSHVIYREMKYLGGPVYCQNCLSKTFPMTSQEVRKLYNNVLSRITFTSIRIRGSLFRPTCPFAQLFLIIFREKGTNIKQVQFFDGDDRTFYNNIYNCVYNRGNSILPNLEVLHLDHSPIPPAILVSFSKLQRIYSIVGCPLEKLGCMTSISVDELAPFEPTNFFQNLKDTKPKLEKIVIFPTFFPELNETFTVLRPVICKTLRKLSCSVDWLVEFTNNGAILGSFDALKVIEISRFYSEFNQIENRFREDFQHLISLNLADFAPNLLVLEVTLQKRDNNNNEYFSCENYQNVNTKSTSVKELGICGKLIPTIAIEEMFPNLTLLHFIGAHPQWLESILGNPKALPFLQDLMVEALEGVQQFDYLLGIHEDELRDLESFSLEDIRQLCIVPSQYSIMNRRNLKRIIFGGFHHNCERNVHRRPYVSLGMAKFVCAKSPDFSIDLIRTSRCDCYDLVGYFQAFDLQELSPYLKIQENAYDGFRGLGYIREVKLTFAFNVFELL